jgi:hypothetical protein
LVLKTSDDERGHDAIQENSEQQLKHTPGKRWLNVQKGRY